MFILRFIRHRRAVRELKRQLVILELQREVTHAEGMLIQARMSNQNLIERK